MKYYNSIFQFKPLGIPLLLAILTSTLIHAQHSKKETDLSHAILTYSDGSREEGNAKLLDKFSILFQEEGDSMMREVSYSDISELYIKLNKTHRQLVPKIIEGEKGKDSLQLIEIVSTGKVSLFKLEGSGFVTTTPLPVLANGNPGLSVPIGYSSIKYFISRDDNPYVTPMRTANTRAPLFKSIAKRYFYDCPALLKKINNKDFKNVGVQAVVNYYNENCPK